MYVYVCMYNVMYMYDAYIVYNNYPYPHLGMSNRQFHKFSNQSHLLSAPAYIVIPQFIFPLFVRFFDVLLSYIFQSLIVYKIRLDLLSFKSTQKIRDN